MKGFLVIHVGGYKLHYSGTLCVFGDGRAVPDSLLPPPHFEPETPDWYEQGWAVGDNSRDRFCKWGDLRKMRRFRDYDEAVAYVYRLRQKRKTRRETYTLVYVVDHPVRTHHMVSSMDAIDAIDRKITEDDAAREAGYRDSFPGVELLLKHHSQSTAHQLSRFLATIRTDGLDKAREGVSRATFYKRLAQLRKCGLVA